MREKQENLRFGPLHKGDIIVTATLKRDKATKMRNRNAVNIVSYVVNPCVNA